MCECAVWSDLDYKAGQKNNETLGFESRVLLHFFLLLLAANEDLHMCRHSQKDAIPVMCTMSN